MTHSLLKNKTWFILLFLAVVTLLAFWQVSHCDFINYDDYIYVTRNGPVQNGLTVEGIRWAFTATYAANWHPLTWISHMLDVQLFGLNPRWHHLTSLLFHIANTLLLFLVLLRMTKALWQSAFVAVLFALHPLHVESVAWVAERKDVLSTFFWMLTMGAYLYYVERPGLQRYLAVLIFFALGLMAKPMLVTLPFVLLLLDFWPLRRNEQKESAIGKLDQDHYPWTRIRFLLWEKTPLFVLTVLSCIVTYYAQQQGGAVASVEAYPLSVRVSNAFASYIFYIDKMIWPTDLAVLYPHPGLWPIWLVAGAALPIIAATIMVILKAKKYPYVAVGWLWYVGTLVPVIGLIQVGNQTRADRYTYIPLIGLFIIVAWGLPELMREWRFRKEALAASAAISLLGLFAVTWTQVGYWRNSMSLYDRALSVTHRNFVMYTSRGMTYLEIGNPTWAIQDYDRALSIDPKYATAYNNRGMAYGILGDHRRALEEFDRAIALDPKTVIFYYNRGIAYDQLGRYDEAYEDLQTAARMGSENAKDFLKSHKVNWQ